MTEPHRSLTILLKLCDQIDELFIEEVGPFGQLVVTETRESWLDTGPRVKTTDVRLYIDLLAREIPDADHRQHFLAKANALFGST